MTTSIRSRFGTVTAAALLAAAGVARAHAQEPTFSGYYLNVATAVGEGPVAPGGASDFQRLRLMGAGPLGPVRLDLAYEHTLVVRESGVPGALIFTGAGTGGAGGWADLGGRIDGGEHWDWRHGVDRLSLQIDIGESADLVVGRQPISWAATLIMTPGDPFSPFDPSDPFREYRTGVDAARLRYYRGPFTQLELVVRPARFGDRETLTALARASTNRSGWDLGAWGGALHDAFAAGASATGGVGSWALRVEAVVRETDDGTALRSAVGLDRSMSLAGRELYVTVEYQRDGLGAADPEDFLPVLLSDELAQGEIQVLSRHTGASQLSYQVHPLVSADLLTLVSLSDGSVLLGPGVGYSVTHSAAVRVGAFVGLGEGARVEPGGVPAPRSAYGATPDVLFASLSVFF